MSYCGKRFYSKITDIFSAIHPIYLTTHFLGLSSYKVSEINNKKCYKSTILMSIKAFIQFGFLIAFVSYNLTFQETPKDSNSIADNITYYQDIMTCTLSVANVGFGLIFTKKMCKIINRLHEIDLEFESLGVQRDYRKTYLKCFLSTLMAFFSIVGYLGFMVYIAKDVSGIFFFTSLSNYYPYFLNIVVELQYANYATIIGDKYKILNNYLEELFQNVHGAWFIESYKTPPKIQKPSKSDSDQSSWIDTVARFHIKLANAATFLNHAFRVQLLLLISTSFVGIVSSLFLIAINFKDSEDEDKNTKNWNYMFTTWAFTNALALVVIVHTTSRICDEANRCPKILHAIRNKTADSKLHETIEMYSLQMYHNRLQFDVCGLFSLDYTLLYTIVASVTTHLVILIQFNSGQHQSVSKTSTNNNSLQQT
ncbi:putative gustatory receptor 28b [Onthophagus taurus]|uniref:putative gustatory receptor 28b n=1 Tax=Onthophagus taurus TaxID=166361 RepID=UPI0039BE170E